MTSACSQSNQLCDDDRLAQLEAANRQLRQQLRHAQRLATVGTMTAMIIHEFNNILTPIVNYAQLAQDGDPLMTEKAITKAASGGRRASDICNALLGMLRSESAQPTCENVKALIQDALLAMGRNFEKDGITLTMEISDALEVIARPAELKQVLVNLLLNARAALLGKGRGKSISIRATAVDGAVEIAVDDTGTGIAPEHMEQLFEPFFTTKTGDDGTEQGNGLGLALCREIVTDMGGAIRVESIYGEGASFIVTLPSKA